MFMIMSDIEITTHEAREYLKLHYVEELLKLR